MDQTQLTPRSIQLFKDLANDAGNWGGSPLFGGNVGCDKGDKGNLTQLKKAGLLTTQEDEGLSWVNFTEAGVEYARSLGIEIEC